MRILVTGCAGFIGSHLTESLLGAGHTVIGLDNFDPFYEKSVKQANIAEALGSQFFTLIEDDIRNISKHANEIGHVDAVFHLAAKAGVLPSLKDPAGYIETNIGGTLSILEWMKENGCKKMLFASSSSVYGNSKQIPFSEDTVQNEPVSPYAFTKLSGEMLNYNYHHLFGLDIINLRFFTVYGPRQRPDLAIHKFINRLFNKQPIDVYGDGETARDYTYVADTVAGLIMALEYILSHERVFETINLGNNQPVSLNEMIRSIEQVAGKKFEINKMGKQPGDVDITYASIDKARRLLHYNPVTDFRDGLDRFLKWKITSSELTKVKGVN